MSHSMRRYICLVEDSYPHRDTRWTAFLEAVDVWCGFMENDEFESNKPILEKELLKYEDIARNFRTLHFGMLFRATGGISKRQLADIKRGKPFELGMEESALSSWTTNPEVAERFARRREEDGLWDDTHAVVIQYSARNLDVFLAIQDLRSRMNEEERRIFDSIEIGMLEAEVIVKHPPKLLITAQNIYP